VFGTPADVSGLALLLMLSHDVRGIFDMEETVLERVN